MHEQAINAWSGAEARYQPGQRVQGVVTRIAQFGVFVEVEPGLEGILYAFELGPGALADMTHGQQLLLSVKSIDVHKKRLELELEQQTIPGLLTEQHLPPEVRRKKDLALPPASLPAGGLFTPLPQPLLPEAMLTSQAQSCPTCQHQVQPSWKYCVYCGGTLQRHCQTCGTTQPALPDARYCYECGQLLP